MRVTCSHQVQQLIRPASCLAAVLVVAAAAAAAAAATLF